MKKFIIIPIFYKNLKKNFEKKIFNFLLKPFLQPARSAGYKKIKIRFF